MRSHSTDTSRNESMTSDESSRRTLSALDAATVALVRQSARITVGSDESVREGFAECSAAAVPSVWLEELVLQSYLFAGFPRALNAAREWRRSGGAHEPGSAPEGYANLFDWRMRGEETCAIVYGSSYEKLRENIRGLHGSLDEWMIVEGYGKVLGRPALDLLRRELCIVAACAAAGQDRQLHSHLRGASNAGATTAMISAALDSLVGVIDADLARRASMLWARVAGK